MAGAVVTFFKTLGSLGVVVPMNGVSTEEAEGGGPQVWACLSKRLKKKKTTFFFLH